MKFIIVTIAVIFRLASAQSVYSLASTIPWTPKTPSSVDQSLVYNDTYYLADRSNAGVHVISLADTTNAKLITGFTTGIVNGSISSTISGPDGLVVLPSRNELWVGDGDGTVKIIDLFESSVAATINTTSSKRADELAYDPTNDLVVATNPNENPPYVSVMSAANRTLLGRITFSDAFGLEQPAFNPADGLFYVSVPSSKANPGGAISTLNIANMSIVKTYPLPDCVPAGIIFGPTNALFVACSASQITEFGYAASYILDVSTGKLAANISGLAGSDQVAYSSSSGLFFAAAYQNMINGTVPQPQVAVVNASSGKLVQTFATDNVTAHAVAVDNKSGLMIVPIMKQGIVTYSFMAGAGGSGTSASGTTGGSATATGSATTSTKTSGALKNFTAQVLGVFSIASITAIFAL
ncbi:hypothetical protein BP6252_07049 [Coleophoma cylindrospora]|uniref:Uncharacterized protein n=1 Tax=Coleophoma cylindrospora TaxID=1849047 RepID=A0A3D8RGH9_9HELO|nr:hypothetical protein BP6252_07049 [Coleophoma cylindrospora]